MTKAIFILALIVGFVLPCHTHAQLQDKLPLLDGSIGKYKIVMQVSFDYDKNTVSGWYYYKSKGSKNKVKLTGKFKGDSPFDGLTMTEVVNGKITGNFDCNYSWGTGDLSLGGNTPFVSMDGVFINASGKKFDFEVSNF